MKKIFLYILMVIVIITAAYAGGNNESNEMEDKDDAMMAKEDDAMMMNKPIPDEPGFYSTQDLQPRVLPFTSEADAQRLAEDGKVVYLFAASWCPSCKAAHEGLTEGAGSIPDDVTLILVNFDNSSSLQSKYGVAVQHTYVQIGPMGEKKAVWSGSTTVDDILSNIVE